MTDKPARTTRRSALKSLGSGTTSLVLLGAGTASAETDFDGRVNSQEDGDVEPDAITDVTIQFDPYEISLNEDSTLHCSWHFQSLPPIAANYYQIDILVNYYRIEFSGPDTVATSVGTDDITKDWEYRSDSPVGPAFHWQAKLWVSDVLGTTAYVDADIDPSRTGEVEAKAGTFWPVESWSTAYLTIS